MARLILCIEIRSINFENIQTKINPPNYSRYPSNPVNPENVTKIVAVINDPTYVHELHFDQSLLSRVVNIEFPNFMSIS